MRPIAACRLCIQGPPGEILRHVHAICGISFNPCPIISWGVTQRLICGLGFSNAGFMLILTHIAAYRAVRAEIEGEFFFRPSGPVVICVAAAFSADALGANRD